MNEKIAFLLNQQINKEFYSAYLYLDMSNYYDDLDLDGFANYYLIQAQEERDHAMLFLKYMQEVGLKVTLEAIDKPDKVFNNPMDPLEIAAEHERYVTALINDIFDRLGDRILSCHAKDIRWVTVLSQDDAIIGVEASLDVNDTKFTLKKADGTVLAFDEADLL